MSLYDKYVLPKLLNSCCSNPPMVYQRKKVVPLAEGDVLEVGIGSGLNLPFYDKSKINKLWGLDPSEELNKMAAEVAKEEKMEVDFIISGAEEIPLPDNKVDTVILTYTMCTIPDVDLANKEIKRVLKKDGQLIGNLPLAYHLKDRIQILRGRKLMISGDPTHLQFLSYQDVTKLLSVFFIIKKIEVLKGGKKKATMFPKLFARNIAFICK